MNCESLAVGAISGEWRRRPWCWMRLAWGRPPELYAVPQGEGCEIEDEHGMFICKLLTTSDPALSGKATR